MTSMQKAGANSVETSPPQRATHLMDAALRTLGRHSAQQHLLAVLKACELDCGDLLRTGSDKPYAASWPEEGLSLMLQQVAPEAGTQGSQSDSQPGAQQCQPSWGLHALILDAATWRGAWPGQIEPKSVTPQGLLAALHGDPAQSLCLPDLVSTQVQGIDGQSWSASAVFESGKLQSLTLMRTGEWSGASVLAPWPVTGV